MAFALVGLVLALGAITLAANLIERRADNRDRQRFTLSLIVINLPLPLFGVLLLLQPALLGGADGAATTAATSGWTLLFMGLLGLLPALPPVRRALARILPIDPQSAVHALALVLGGYLVGQALGNQASGGLETLETAASSAGLLDVVLNQLVFLLLGLLGVGWLTRRRGAALAERLGLSRPGWAQIRAGLLWIVPLILLQGLAGSLWMALQPEQAAQLESVNSTLLANFDTVGEWFVLAAAPGIAEEILFRGALQPVLGIWLSTLLFALAHNQYALSPGTAIVFAVGLALGHIRRRHGTTTAMIVHFSYNFGLGLLSLLATRVGA